VLRSKIFLIALYNKSISITPAALSLIKNLYHLLYDRDRSSPAPLNPFPPMHTQPVNETSLTLTFPSLPRTLLAPAPTSKNSRTTHYILFVVSNILPQSSNIVNGTPSLSQYVTRSTSTHVSIYNPPPPPGLFLKGVISRANPPLPFFANSRSVSLAALRSLTPSPA